jgi:hypothetical protein
MSTQVTLLIGNNSYSVSSGTSFWRIEDTDLAFPPIRRLEEYGPLQHGTTDLGFRLNPRIITLRLKSAAQTTIGNLYTNRATLIDYFKPTNNTPIQVRYTLDNGNVRQIDCYTVAFKADERDRSGFVQTYTIALKANDPLFYDPVQRAVTWSTMGSGFAVPLAVPVAVGTGPAINDIYRINYSGTFPSYPIIVLTGPMNGPIVKNLVTGDKLDFTGFYLPGNYSITIDTRFGFKTVKDSNGVTQLGKLSRDSALGSFRLETDPNVPNNINSILIEAANVKTGAQAVMYYYSKYIGL